jgi:hypothetical protein
MKKTLVYAVLALEALICIALEISGAIRPEMFTSVMAFPFEQAGLGLRELSLSGTSGNWAAICLYAAICLLPAVYWAIFRARKGLRPEDILLAVMSAALFGGIYIIINPGWLHTYLSVDMERGITGCALHSIWIGYVILRILRRPREGGSETLLCHFRRLIWLTAAVFVYIIAGSCLGDLLTAFSDLAKGNTMPGANLGFTRACLVMGYINSALAYAMDLPVLFAAAALTAELGRDQYGEGAALAAERLARRCSLALAVTVISNAAFNVLQLLCAPRLLVVTATVQLPLLSIMLALATLLAAGYIRSGRGLKQDNDLFI